jgi:hypothetical protein
VRVRLSEGRVPTPTLVPEHQAKSSRRKLLLNGKDLHVAADYAMLAANLCRFYDFTDKVVLFVGAGGGQLLDCTVRPKKRIAIDPDRKALQALQEKAVANNLDSFEVVASAFDDVALPADVVYFEFCLHEMVDPAGALAHARTLAPDIVVFDHAPDSAWSFYAAEDDKVRWSSEALRSLYIQRCTAFRAEQRFKNYDELAAKLAPQGPLAIQRIAKFAHATNIAIPMDCILALL